MTFEVFFEKSWTETGTAFIEADSREEALEAARELNDEDIDWGNLCPDGGEYEITIP